jgi:serine/threonine-protein kinase
MPVDLDDHARGRVGSVINKKYRLERLIGSGGMASVYEAVHRNGHRVAIKMLHPNLCLNPDLRARFLREGYVANKVNHQGAVRVLDDDTTDDGSVFLVMELLKGETLDARWEGRGSRLPHREVCEHAHQLLDVLAAAHGEGVVHRDIKPENLFLTSDGVLKVLDFGIARLNESTGAQGATQTGRMIGTPAFMPPEQALGRSRQIDGQTDLWAVGATMFTLVSGHFVHEAETMEEMLVRAGSRLARSVTGVLPSLPPPIGSVIDQALAFEKGQRWPDARAMARALEDAYRLVYAAPIPGSRGSNPPLGSLAHRVGLRGQDEIAEDTTIMSPAELPRTGPAGLAGTGTEPLPDRPPIPAGALLGGMAEAPLPSAETTVPMVPATIGGISATTDESTIKAPAPKTRPAGRRVAIAAVAAGTLFALLGASLLVAVFGGRHGPAMDGAGTTKAPLASVAPPAVAPGPVAPALASAIGPLLQGPPTIRIEDLPSIVLPPEVPAKLLPARPRTAPAEPVPAKPRSIASQSVGSASATPPALATPQPKPNCSPPFVVDAAGKKKWKVECL